jgi:hypothetical protein
MMSVRLQCQICFEVFFLIPSFYVRNNGKAEIGSEVRIRNMWAFRNRLSEYGEMAVGRLQTGVAAYVLAFGSIAEWKILGRSDMPLKAYNDKKEGVTVFGCSLFASSF